MVVVRVGDVFTVFFGLIVRFFVVCFRREFFFGLEKR